MSIHRNFQCPLSFMPFTFLIWTLNTFVSHQPMWEFNIDYRSMPDIVNIHSTHTKPPLTYHKGWIIPFCGSIEMENDQRMAKWNRRTKERIFHAVFAFVWSISFHFISFHAQCITIKLRNFSDGKIWNENRKWNLNKMLIVKWSRTKWYHSSVQQTHKSNSHSIPCGKHWLWHDFVIILSNRCFASMTTLNELK